MTQFPVAVLVAAFLFVPACLTSNSTFADEAPPAVADSVKDLVPGLEAKVLVNKGTATILVFAMASETIVFADGVRYEILKGSNGIIPIHHEAVISTGSPVTVQFEGKGVYGDSTRTIAYDGVGSIDQDAPFGVMLFGNAEYTARAWEFVDAHDRALVHTVDVRDVAAFDQADLHVRNCWTAYSMDDSKLYTTGCRFTHRKKR